MQETPPDLYTAGPTPPSTLPLLQIVSLISTASESAARPFTHQASTFVPLMRAAGFTDVSETRLRLPIGAWPSEAIEKEIGRYNVLNVLEGVEAYTLALFTRVLGMSAEEVRELVERARADVCNRKHRWYIWLYVFFPLSSPPNV